MNLEELAAAHAADSSRLDKLTATLAAVVNYLEADLETARLEGRRLDATTSGLELLESRVRVLELARRRGNGNASRDELARRVIALELAAGLDNADHSRAV